MHTMTLENKTITFWLITYHNKDSEHTYYANSIPKTIAYIKGSIIEYTGMDNIEDLDMYLNQLADLMEKQSLIQIVVNGYPIEINRIALDQTSQISQLVTRFHTLLAKGSVRINTTERDELLKQISHLYK